MPGRIYVSPTGRLESVRYPARPTAPTGELLTGAQVPVSAFSDAFTGTTIDTSKWTASVGITQSGTLTIPCTSGYPSLQSIPRYGVLGSAASVQVLQTAGPGTGTCETLFLLELDANNHLRMERVGGSMAWGYRTAGTDTINYPAWDASLDKWWRISESGGTVSFQVSSTGAAWTTIGTITTPGWASASLQVSLKCGYYGTETSPQPAIFDNLNIAPTMPTTAARAIHSGVWAPDPDASTATWQTNLNTFEADAGKRPDLVVFYQQWSGTPAFPSAYCDILINRGQTPVITWEPWLYTGGVTQPTYSLANIIAGNFDTYITTWANAAKAYGATVYLRFAHEMNGNWYPWCEGVNGNTTGQYAAAWQHVKAIFTANAVTNVKWVWSPNVPDTGLTALSGLYPGSTYVDVTGLDGYATSTSWRSWDQLFAAGIDQVRALDSTHPLWVVETGATETGGSKSAWIADMFTTLKYRTEVTALCWWNDTKSPDAYSIETSTGATSAYAAGITDPRYAGGQARATIPFDLTAGTTITSANTPGATITNGAGSTSVASAAHLHSGAAGAQMNGAASQASIVRVLLPAATNSAAARAYFWYSGTAPATQERIMGPRNNSPATVARASVTTAGKLALEDATGTTRWTSAAVLPSTGLFRTEMWVMLGSTTSNGSAHLAYYQDDSLTPIETVDLTDVNLGLLQFTNWDFGRLSTGAAAVTQYVDDIAVQTETTAELGPLTTAQTASVTFAGSSSLTVAPLVTEVATIGLAGTSTLTVTPLVTATASVGFASTSALAVTPAVTKIASVPLAQSSALTVAGSQTIPSTVTLAQSSALAVVGTDTIANTVALAQTSALTVTPLVTHPATVPLTSSSTLAVTASVTEVAAVGFAGSSALTVIGTQTVGVAITIAGTSTLAVAPLVTETAAVGFVGSSTLAVVGSDTIPGATSFAQSSALSVAALVTETPAVPLAGSNSLAVAVSGTTTSTVTLTSTSTLGVTPALTRTGLVTLAQTSAVTIIPAVTEVAAVALAGSSALSVTGTATTRGSVALTGTGTLAVTGTTSSATTIALAGTSALTVTPLVTHPAAVALASTSALTVAVTGSTSGAVALAGTNTLGVTVAVTKTASVPLVSSSVLAVTPSITHPAGITLAGSNTVGVVSTGTPSAPVNLTGASALNVAPTVAHLDLITIIGVSALTVTPKVTASATINLASAGTLSVAANVQALAQLILIGTNTISVIADVTPAGAKFNVTWNPTGTPHGNPLTATGPRNRLALTATGNPYTVGPAHGDPFRVLTTTGNPLTIGAP